MSIFGDILSKIFPSGHPAVAQAQTAGTGTSSTQAGPAGTVGGASGSAPSTTQTASTPAASSAPVDVQKILSDKAAQSGQQLNWQTSIVDLMKLLGLDSSLGARKQLAAELHYSGDTNDTATMNVWLIKQVMSQLAANGGKVPANLMN